MLRWRWKTGHHPEIINIMNKFGFNSKQFKLFLKTREANKPFEMFFWRLFFLQQLLAINFLSPNPCIFKLTTRTAAPTIFIRRDQTSGLKIELTCKKPGAVLH